MSRRGIPPRAGSGLGGARDERDQKKKPGRDLLLGPDRGSPRKLTKNASLTAMPFRVKAHEQHEEEERPKT